MQHAQRVRRIAGEARCHIKETNVDEVKQRLDGGEKFVLVDVREESEFAKDHLPGAIHLGKGVIERDIEARVPNLTTPIILYSGGGFRSTLAACNLHTISYSHELSI